MNILVFLRHFRFEGYAIFDLVLAFGGMYLIRTRLSGLFKKIKINIPKINWVYLTLPLGIVFHLLFNSMTPMTKNFFDINGHYFLKILIIFCLVWGLRGIRIIKR